MANFNPFAEEQPKEPKPNWYFKTAMKVTAMTATGFGVYGMYKMRGPIGKLFEKFFNRQAPEIIKESYYKDTNITNPFENAGEDIFKPLGFKRLDHGELLKDLSPSARVVGSARHIEASIATQGKVDIEAVLFRKAEYDKLSGRQAMDADPIFTEIRLQTLREHFTIEGAGGDSHLEDIMSMGTIKSYFQDDKVAQIHKYYLENDSAYAERYLKRIKGFYRNYYLKVERLNLSPDKFRDRMMNRIIDEDYSDKVMNYLVAKKSPTEYIRGYQNANLESLRAIAEGKSVAGVIPEKAKINMYAPSDSQDLFEIFKKGDVRKDLFTSDSGMRKSKSETFRPVQQFDYKGHFKGIVGTLEGLKNTEESLDDFSFRLESFGTGHDKKQYAIITLHHSLGHQVDIEVPISVDGRMPGGSPSVGELMDQFFITGDVFGGEDLQINNMTQIILHDVKRMLNSNAFKNEFRDDPNKFNHRIHSVIRRHMNELPRWTGEVRDAFKMMTVQNPLFNSLVYPKRNESRHLRNSLGHAIDSAKNIAKMSKDPNAITITLDFETLARTSAGVQHSVQDPHTQLLKAGIVVSDVNDGNKILFSDELVSKHSVEYFDGLERKLGKDMGWTDSLKNWLRQIVDAGPNDVVTAFKREIANEASSAMSHVTNNREFMKVVTEHLLKYKEWAEAQATPKNVYIVTKNGWQFDLNFIKIHDPIGYNQLVKSSKDGKRTNVIDVHSIAYARTVGKFGEESLAQEELVKTMLGKFLPDESFDLSTEAGTVRVLKKLNKKMRGQIFKNKKAVQLLGNLEAHMPKTLRAHKSPKVDTLLTSALLKFEVHQYLNDPAFYDGFDRAEDFIAFADKNKSIFDYMDLLNGLENQNIPGLGHVSFSGVSQGMAAQLKRSLLHLNDMIPFGDNPYNKQYDQIHRGLPVGPSTSMMKTLKKQGHDPHSWKVRRMFTAPISTGAAIDFESNMMATSNSQLGKNYYSHHLVADTLYLWNPFGGAEGYFALTEEYANKIRVSQDSLIPLSDNSFMDDPVLNDRIRDFRRQVENEAFKISKSKGQRGNITHEIWEEAGLRVADRLERKNDGLVIPFDSKMKVAKGDMSVSIYNKQMGGRVTGVWAEPTVVTSAARSMPRLYMKVLRSAEGDELRKMPAVGTTLGTKSELSVIKLLSHKSAFNPVDAIANADFLQKGHVGPLKRGLMGKIVRKHVDVINSSSSSRKEKLDAKRKLRTISEKIGADMELGPSGKVEKLVLNSNRQHDFRFTHLKDPGVIEQARQYIGDIDLSLKEIMGFMKDAGIVYSRKQAEEFNGMFGGDANIKKQVRVAINKVREEFDKKWKSNRDVMSQLTTRGKNTLFEDLEALVEFLTAKEGAPILFESFRGDLIPGEKQLPAIPAIRMSAETIALANIDHGMQTSQKQAVIRRDYLMTMMAAQGGISNSTLDYLYQNENIKRFKKHKIAAKTYREWRQTMLSSELAKSKQLDLKELDAIIDREGQLELSREKNQALSESDMDVARDRLEQLMEMDENLTDDIKRSELSNQLDQVLQAIRNKDLTILKSMEDGNRWFGHKRVNDIVKLARKSNGVVSLDLTFGNNTALNLPIKQIVENMGESISGAPDKTPAQMKVVANKIIDMIKGMDEMAQGKAMFKIIEEGGEQKVQMKNIAINFDPRIASLFNRVTDDFYLANGETKVKFEVLKAYKEYSKIASSAPAKHMQELQNKGYSNDEQLNATLQTLQRSIVRYLAFGVDYSKKSDYWLADQITVDGIWVRHKGAEGILAAAHALQQSNKLQLGGFKRTAPAAAQDILTKMLESDMNTVFITQKLFNEMTTLYDGNVVNYAKLLDKQNNALYQKVIKGQETLPGGVFTRYPITQSGRDGMMDFQMHVVPDDVGEYLGMDENSFFAHTILSRMLKFDSDGDRGYLLMKNIATTQGIDGLRKEMAERTGELLERNHVQDILRKSNVQRMLIDKGQVEINEYLRPLDIEGDYVWLAGYESLGSVGKPGGHRLQLKREKVHVKQVDWSDMFTQPIKVMRASLESSAEHATDAMVRAKADAAILASLSKRLIPEATNVIKKRVAEQMVGKVKDPATLIGIAGDLRTGLAGLSQAAIDVAKRYEDVSALSMLNDTFQFIMDPSKTEYREAAKQIWVESFTKGAEFDKEDRIAAAEESFKIAMDTSDWVNRATRYDSKVKAHQSAINNVLMGTNQSTLMDLFLTEVGYSPASRLMGTAMDGAEGYVPHTTASVLEGLFDGFRHKFNITPDRAATFKKAGKYGAIAAGAFLALNLFRPNQLSSSANPLDMFVDLGVDHDGSRNRLSSNLELDRRVPVDTVDASFSREAYIKMNSGANSNRRSKSNIINNMLANTSFGIEPFVHKFKTDPYSTYSNYTSNVGYLGNSNISRRSKLT